MEEQAVREFLRSHGRSDLADLDYSVVVRVMESVKIYADCGLDRRFCDGYIQGAYIHSNDIKVGDIAIMRDYLDHLYDNVNHSTTEIEED